MDSRLIRNSFFCGLSIFAISFLFVLVEDTSVLLIVTNILPGFVYGIVLCNFENNRLDLRRLLFITFSGALFIFVAWVATGYSFFGRDNRLTFPLGSVIGSASLFFFYYFLIDNNLLFVRGFTLAILTGLLSSVIPVLGNQLDKQIGDLSVKQTLSLGFTLLIFVVWQTLFGWIIIKCKKREADMRFVAMPIDL